MKKFTFEEKIKLSKRIMKITLPIHVKNIRKIITSSNPTVKITTYESEEYLNFEDLTDETYEKIENYLDKHKKTIYLTLKVQIDEDIDDLNFKF